MVFCHQCGANNPTGSFCNQCGTKLNVVPPPVAVSAATPAAAPAHVPAPVAPRLPERDGPMCYGCGKTLVGQETYAIVALGGHWHKDCFKCSKCGEKLFSFSKFFEEDGKPVCNKCNMKTVPFCSACQKKVEGKYKTHGNKSFHPECFKCAKCGQGFDEDGFYEDHGKLWHLTCALPN